MSEQLNKEDIVRLIAKETGYRKVAVERIYESFVDNVTKALVCDKKVNVTGLGIFEPRLRAARVGRNVREGIPVRIPARRMPYFTPSDKLKDAVSKEANK